MSEAARNILLVAACALIDADGRILLAQRPEGKSLAGLWEFPGGKVEPGETPEESLVRELHEELGITTKVACLAPLTFASHTYEKFHLLMPLYVCRRWQGTPAGHEGQALKWVKPVARMTEEAMMTEPSDRVAVNLPGSPSNVCTTVFRWMSVVPLLATRATIPPMASSAHSPEGTSLA